MQFGLILLHTAGFADYQPSWLFPAAANFAMDEHDHWGT